jgi:hypothetical protein
MTIAQIEHNLQALFTNFQQDEFIYQLLLAYGHPQATIVRLKSGDRNLSKIAGEIDWKKKLFFKSIDLEGIEQIKDVPNFQGFLKHDPRFVILTDYTKFLAFDTKTEESLAIALEELPKHYDFFLPWAGIEKATLQQENPADVKAAEKMARLYDEIRKDNQTDAPTTEEVHNLNVFLSRLLFCFFAEDTGIFEKSQFSIDLKNHTQEDGNDLDSYLDRLFAIMNQPFVERDAALPKHLADFPYVNGGLFRNLHHAPRFSRKSRTLLLECGDLDWAAINPDIFGSMIQAVVTPEHRGGMGMHYTSVPNIMKVIEPLFLNELKEEFENAKGNLKKINELLKRIWRIKIFDPACGSGNFLIIAYKELRKLEMAIFKEIDRINQTFSTQFSGIQLNNFYGIELDDFAHEVAILSLWLAEHQMNQAFFNEFGRIKSPLPLQSNGNIVQGNACRLDWEKVCPQNPDDEIYILGNPPYLGARVQNAEQKSDLDFVFKGFSKYKDLDYIACWFYKAGIFIKDMNAKYAFVSTNSICQGEQVALLWPILFDISIEIFFAHTSFKWTNNAKANAGVTVIIIGLKPVSLKGTRKIIFEGKISKDVGKINAYLTSGNNIFVERRNTPLANLPSMPKGNMPYDGGHLLLSTEEKNSLLLKYPQIEPIIKRLVGSFEFINGVERWCLWISNDNLKLALSVPEIENKIENVKLLRLNSSDSGANKLALRAHQFREVNETISQSVVVPSVSSENRQYVPIGFITSNTIVTNLAFAIYEAEAWLFALLTSRMHMVWIKAVCGNLETRIRYSSSLGYNTFPFPPISEAQKQELEGRAYGILETREAYSEKTLAQLYDPDKMPADLREAHRQNDLAVERCYRSKPFESDEERLEYLFKLYEQMIEEEKTKGTLFAVEKKTKKK